VLAEEVRGGPIFILFSWGKNVFIYGCNARGKEKPNKGGVGRRMGLSVQSSMRWGERGKRLIRDMKVTLG